MAQTNIHTAAQLLARAHYQGIFSDQATISPHNKQIFIISGSLNSMDIERYTWSLRTAELGSWVEKDTSSEIGQPCNADVGVSIPQIRVSPGLDRGASNYDDLQYLLIIQGVTGSRKVKVMVEPSIERAATSMMAEALNGYSTVFSAAFRRRPRSSAFASPVGSTSAVFKKVASDNGWNANDAEIGLLC